MTLRADSARARDRMLAAARRRMADGDLELPLNAVAKDAGVGVGTAYRHFATRQALLEALAQDSLIALAETARQAADDPDPAHGLRTLITEGLRALEKNPALEPVLASGTDLEPARDLLASFERLLGKGAVRPGVTPNDLRALICGVQHAADVAGGNRDLYLEVMLAGLRSGPAPDRSPTRP